MKQIKHFFQHAFLFAGKNGQPKQIRPSIRHASYRNDAMAKYRINRSAGKFNGHCWCDGSGYSPCDFSNSNCTDSVRIDGVWKANKF